MKRLTPLLKPLLLTTALLAGHTLLADELVVSVGQQGADKASLDRPKTGMRADKVEEKFGAPIKKNEAVGKPPISSWEYPEYRVYFEADRVIHTVLKPMPKEADTDLAPVAAAPVAPVTEPTPAPAAAPFVAPAAPSVAPAPATESAEVPAAQDEVEDKATDKPDAADKADADEEKSEKEENTPK